jgi:hypothetical protein
MASTADRLLDARRRGKKKQLPLPPIIPLSTTQGIVLWWLLLWLLLLRSVA